MPEPDDDSTVKVINVSKRDFAVLCNIVNFGNVVLYTPIFCVDITYFPFQIFSLFISLLSVTYSKYSFRTGQAEKMAVKKILAILCLCICTGSFH